MNVKALFLMIACSCLFPLSSSAHLFETDDNAYSYSDCIGLAFCRDSFPPQFIEEAQNLGFSPEELLLLILDEEESGPSY